MPRASNPKPSSKLLASRPSWPNWKAGETNCGNRTVNVFLNVFNLMYAKPLDVTRIRCPRISRGGHAERPREISVPWPEPWHVHDRSPVGNSPRTRFIRVRELSMSALSPPTQARSQPGRIREHVPVSTVREQASTADTNCPQTVRSLAPSMSAHSSRPSIRRDHRLASNCPRRRMLASILWPARFPVRLRFILSFPSYVLL